MNNTMAINTYLSQSNLKNKLSKEEQRQNHGYGEHSDDCQMGWGFGGMYKKARGLRSTNR